MAHVGLGRDEHFSDSGHVDGFCVKLGRRKCDGVEYKVFEIMFHYSNIGGCIYMCTGEVDIDRKRLRW